MPTSKEAKAKLQHYPVVKRPGLLDRPVGLRSGKHGYVVPILAMTLSYLILELGFNARLLDVTGSLATSIEVISIERWGRIISGLAVPLFVWGTFLMPRAWRANHAVRQIIYTLTLSGGALMAVTFVGEKALVDGIVDRSSGLTRHAAAELRLVVNGILTGSAQVSGIELSPDVLASPEGKSFLAMLPLQALVVPDLQNTLKGPIRTILEHDVRKHLGSPERLFSDTFEKSVTDVDRRFQSYAAAQSGISGTAVLTPEQLWQKFVDDLERTYHLTPDNIPTTDFRATARMVEKSGVPVPLGWAPTDHRAFIEAAQKAILERTSALAGDIPPGLDRAAFFALPQVQDAWKRASGISPDEDTALWDPGMDEAAFDGSVYEPMIARAVNRQTIQLSRPDEAFADGGTEQTVGRDAMQSLVAPPIALLISLTGALVHVFKSVRYGISVGSFSRKKDAAAAIVVFGAGLLAFAIPNRVSRSDAFTYLQGRMAREGLAMPAAGVRWVIQAQPYAYPMNEWIRQHMLNGLSFGYGGKD